MDYGLGFALTFKCIFCYVLIWIFFVGTQYMILDGETNMDLKEIKTKNLTNK
jgi:hypothetical protein